MDKVNGVKNMMESGYPPSDAERAGLSRFVLKSLLLLSASLAKDLRSRKNLPADVLTCINVFVCCFVFAFPRILKQWSYRIFITILGFRNILEKLWDKDSSVFARSCVAFCSERECITCYNGGMIACLASSCSDD